MCQARNYYLDLMKRCLTNWIYAEHEKAPLSPKALWKRKIIGLFKSRGLEVVNSVPIDRKMRAEGKDWPPHAHTMIGFKRLDNIQFCAQDILKNNIPGDFVEAGVWRGGASIFMRAILKAYDIEDRIVWLADSFEGLPKPDVKKYPQDANFELHAFEILAVSLDQVKANFELYGLLDEKVRFLKGWFKDTLPKAPIKQIALMRLDGDMYESTMEALVNLYPRLSQGGYIIVDDYNSIRACREAVHDYLKSQGITAKIIPIDYTGAYWRRE